MANINVKLKNASGDVLYPKTLWSNIEGKPSIYQLVASFRNTAVPGYIFSLDCLVFLRQTTNNYKIASYADLRQFIVDHGQLVPNGNGEAMLEVTGILHYSRTASTNNFIGIIKELRANPRSSDITAYILKTSTDVNTSNGGDITQTLPRDMFGSATLVPYFN